RDRPTAGGRPPASRSRPCLRPRAAPARHGRWRGASGESRRANDGTLRVALPRERGARTAPAATPPGPARPAVAAAQARGRPALGGGTLRGIPDRARDVPRMPSGRLRHARAHRAPRRDPFARDSPHYRGYADAIAVRGVAPLQLRRELHLRG